MNAYETTWTIVIEKRDLYNQYAEHLWPEEISEKLSIHGRNWYTRDREVVQVRDNGNHGGVYLLFKIESEDGWSDSYEEVIKKLSWFAKDHPLYRISGETFYEPDEIPRRFELDRFGLQFYNGKVIYELGDHYGWEEMQKCGLA